MASQDYAEAVQAARNFYGVDRTVAAESLQWRKEQKPMTAAEWREVVKQALRSPHP